MSVVATIARTLDDWMNPIAVKELRQAVRAKYIAGLLLLFLVGSTIVVGVYGLRWDRDDIGGAGAAAARAIALVLYASCALLVPVYCAVRFAAEQRGEGFDLVLVTRLRAARIVWGKFASGLIVVLLIVSASAPFLLMTYFLRGVGLPDLFLFLVWVMLYASVSIQVGLFVACARVGMAGKIALGIVAMLAYTYVATLVFVLVPSLFYRLGWSIFLLVRLGILGSSGGLLAQVVTGLYTVAAYFAFTSALLSSRASNRILPVRITLTAAWAIGGVLLLINPLFFTDWFRTTIPSFAVMLLVAACEREQPGARVARWIPRRRFWRPGAFLLYSGAAGGMIWASLILGLTLVIAWVFFRSISPVPPEVFMVPGAIGTGALASSLTAVCLRRRTFPRLRWGHTWAVALGLAAVVNVPVALSSPVGAAVSCLCVNAIWAGGVVAASVPWFARQIRGFRPAPAGAVEPLPRGRVLAVPDVPSGEMAAEEAP